MVEYLRVFCHVGFFFGLVEAWDDCSYQRRIPLTSPLRPLRTGCSCTGEFEQQQYGHVPNGWLMLFSEVSALKEEMQIATR